MADLPAAIREAEEALAIYNRPLDVAPDAEPVALVKVSVVRTLLAAARSAESALATERRRREEAEARLTRIREWVGGLGWLGGPQDERVEDECLAILDGEPHV